MKQDERCRLMFGPYDPPKSRRGKFLVCERRGKVKVGGYSDGLITWPVKWGTRNSLILCGDLVEAVRQESKVAVAHHWGVSLETVQGWRRALDVEPYTPGSQWLMRASATERATPREMRRMGQLARPHSRQPKSKAWKHRMSAIIRARIKIQGPINPDQKLWTPEHDDLLGTDADSLIAAKLGRTAGAVQTRRCALGIPLSKPAIPGTWTKAEEQLLGTRPDDEIAKMLGRGARGVQIHRQSLGIPAFVLTPRPWSDKEEALLGTMPDRQLAQKLGRPLQSIQIRRHLRGIPNPAPLRKPWTPMDDALLGTISDAEAAQKLGRNLRAVERRRVFLGVENPVPKRKLWKAEETRVLGTKPDKEIADLLQCSVRRVTTKRVHLGIRAFL